MSEPRGWYSRGRLPHYDGGEILQFITLHLGDAMPPSVLRRWQIELEHEKDEDRKQQLYWRVDKYLDQGIGKCYLRDPEIASMVQESLTHHHGTRYKLISWSIMPNHIHYLFKPMSGNSLSDIMQKFKSYTAHEANKLLNREGTFWQEDYFDRYIRDYEHFEKVIDYIELNPVKAGLCVSKYDWRFGSAYKGSADGSSART